MPKILIYFMLFRAKYLKFPNASFTKVKAKSADKMFYRFNQALKHKFH